MTLNRRTFLAASAAVTAGAAIAAPSIARAQAKDLRLGIITPPGHPWNEAAIKSGEMLKKETNGRLSISVFPSGQLGNEAAMLQQMQSGALDMGYIMTAELGSRVPAIAAINAPWIVDSTAKVAKLVKTPVAMSLFDLLPRETGTVGLAWGITTMRVVFTAKPIEGLADLKGMKLRINTTPAYRDFYQLLGAAPTPIPTPQVFEAMSNGQVDGLEADLDFSWNQRFDKVSKTMLRMNAIFMPCVALVSGRVWQGLSAEDKALITKATQAALATQVEETVTNEPVLIEKFKGTGIAMREAKVGDAETKTIIAEYDKIWLPKAPILTELRKVGATL